MLETTIAGKYRMLRLLGEGGMGAVYEAEHTTTGRRLAVKLITVHPGNKKTEMVTRFEREARMAGTLDTEHIVQVIDSGEDAQLDMPFMVMEMLQGEDVQTLLERVGPLSPDLALRIAAQACIGLRQAHLAGIIHRDIKPANVFLAQRDEGRVIVKILDFGIAKMRLDQGEGSDSGKLTRTGTMVGSPYYMSPEQALGEKDIDFRSDIWSLGVVLYATLTGRTPHEDVEALGQIIMSICSKPAEPVQDRAPWLDPQIAAVVHKALLIDKEKRFATMSEMLEALRALLPHGSEITRDMLGPLPAGMRGKVAARLTSKELGLAASGPVRARSVTSESALRRASADTISASTTGADIRASRSRPKQLVALGAAALVAVAGVVGYAVTRPSAPVAQPSAGTDVATSEPLRTGPVPVVAPSPGTAVASLRTVALAIAPGSAEVEVNGQRTTLKDGKVELQGALGSVHKIRIAIGAQAEEREVVIAESGPVPSRIELVPRVGSVKSPATAVSSPTSPATAPPQTSSRPIKPKTASTVDKNFDQ